jgi:virginiamycin A acetyltransferase
MAMPDYFKAGRGTYWANLAVHRWGNETIEIGSYTSIAQGVSLLAGGLHNHRNVSTFPFDVLMRGAKTASPQDRCYEHGKGIRVGSDCHLGVNCSLVGNLEIGHGAVIAANATVFTDVPPYAIAVGNPARVTKYRFDEATIAMLLRIAWWDWPESGIRAYVDKFYLSVDEFIDFAAGLPVMDKTEALCFA